MRTWIIDTARPLLRDKPPPGGPVTLDEIAACAGITTDQLRAYYDSVTDIAADLDAGPTRSEQAGRC